MRLLKDLVLFIHPLGFVWLLLASWLAWRVIRRQWRGILVPAAAWLILSAFTCTPITAWLLLGLEDQYPSVKLAEAPTADVVICLGGGASPSHTEPARVNFNSTVDRLTSSLGLVALGKAPTLIVTGGGYPEGGVMFSEADAAVSYLKDTLKMPQDIRSLGICSDTHDEALKIAALAEKTGWKKLLLVTSAAHMPRSVAVFRKAGLEVLPVPCDYISSFRNIGDRHWLHLPTLGSLQGIASWLHEVIGMTVYKMRGWI